MNSNRDKSNKRFVFLSILPAYLCVALVVFIPIIKAIIMSFTDYKLTNPGANAWNNFANYKSLFESGLVTTYFKTTLTFILCTVTIQFIVAILIAMLLNSKFIKGRNVMRALFMIPWTIPSVVTALLWSWMFHSQYGIINWLLYHMGLINDINMAWTTSGTLALPSVIIACLWRQTPYMMVMLLAGLQNVPYELIEAGKIDGAGTWSTFKDITLPSIRPVIDSSIIVAVITNSQMFTIIYNMTGGGPMGTTTNFAVGAYLQAFVSYDFGKGSALGVIWLVFLGLLIFIYRHFADKNTNSYL